MGADNIAVLTLVAVCWVLTLVWAWAHGRAEGYWIGRSRSSEAPPISDTAVARIIEAVEAHCGMGHGAWDMVAARDLVEGFAAALGADTRRIDALEARRRQP